MKERMLNISKKKSIILYKKRLVSQFVKVCRLTKVRKVVVMLLGFLAMVFYSCP